MLLTAEGRKILNIGRSRAKKVHRLRNRLPVVRDDEYRLNDRIILTASLTGVQNRTGRASVLLRAII